MRKYRQALGLHDNIATWPKYEMWENIANKTDNCTTEMKMWVALWQNVMYMLLSLYTVAVFA